MSTACNTQVWLWLTAHWTSGRRSRVYCRCWLRWEMKFPLPNLYMFNGGLWQKNPTYNFQLPNRHMFNGDSDKNPTSKSTYVQRWQWQQNPTSDFQLPNRHMLNGETKSLVNEQTKRIYNLWKSIHCDKHTNIYRVSCVFYV